MPVMNGVEATRVLRSRGFTLPICAVTGNALTEDVDAFLAAGANEVLTKPVSKAKLEATLSRYYATNNTTHAVAAAATAGTTAKSPAAAATPPAPASAAAPVTPSFASPIAAASPSQP